MKVVHAIHIKANGRPMSNQNTFEHQNMKIILILNALCILWVQANEFNDGKKIIKRNLMDLSNLDLRNWNDNIQFKRSGMGIGKEKSIPPPQYNPQKTLPYDLKLQYSQRKDGKTYYVPQPIEIMRKINIPHERRNEGMSPYTMERRISVPVYYEQNYRSEKKTKYPAKYELPTPQAYTMEKKIQPDYKPPVYLPYSFKAPTHPTIPVELPIVEENPVPVLPPPDKLVQYEINIPVEKLYDIKVPTLFKKEDQKPVSKQPNPTPYQMERKDSIQLERPVSYDKSPNVKINKHKIQQNSPLPIEELKLSTTTQETKHADENKVVQITSYSMATNHNDWEQKKQSWEQSEQIWNESKKKWEESAKPSELKSTEDPTVYHQANKRFDTMVQIGQDKKWIEKQEDEKYPQDVERYSWKNSWSPTDTKPKEFMQPIKKATVEEVTIDRNWNEDALRGLKEQSAKAWNQLKEWDMEREQFGQNTQAQPTHTVSYSSPKYTHVVPHYVKETTPKWEGHKPISDLKYKKQEDESKSPTKMEPVGWKKPTHTVEVKHEPQHNIQGFEHQTTKGWELKQPKSYTQVHYDWKKEEDEAKSTWKPPTEMHQIWERTKDPKKLFETVQKPVDEYRRVQYHREVPKQETKYRESKPQQPKEKYGYEEHYQHPKPKPIQHPKAYEREEDHYQHPKQNPIQHPKTYEREEELRKPYVEKKWNQQQDYRKEETYRIPYTYKEETMGEEYKRPKKMYETYRHNSGHNPREEYEEYMQKENGYYRKPEDNKYQSSWKDYSIEGTEISAQKEQEEVKKPYIQSYHESHVEHHYKPKQHEEGENEGEEGEGYYENQQNDQHEYEEAEEEPTTKSYHQHEQAKKHFQKMGKYIEEEYHPKEHERPLNYRETIHNQYHRPEEPSLGELLIYQKNKNWKQKNDELVEKYILKDVNKYKQREGKEIDYRKPEPMQKWDDSNLKSLEDLLVGIKLQAPTTIEPPKENLEIRKQLEQEILKGMILKGDVPQQEELTVVDYQNSNPEHQSHGYQLINHHGGKQWQETAQSFQKGTEEPRYQLPSETGQIAKYAEPTERIIPSPEIKAQTTVKPTKTYPVKQWRPEEEQSNTRSNIFHQPASKSWDRPPNQDNNKFSKSNWENDKKLVETNTKEEEQPEKSWVHISHGTWESKYSTH